MSLAGCSGAAAHVPAASPSIATHAFSGAYVVSATLEVYPNGTVSACQTVLLSLPGQCGASVAVTGLGSTRLPFSSPALPRGAYFTPILKLIGTWNGSSLVVSAPPSPSAAQSEPIVMWSAAKPPAVAQMAAGMPTAAGLRDQQTLLNDQAYLEARGIFVMENGFGSRGLEMMVAAADLATIALLRSRYKVQEISSWLIPTTG
jgi:hypothetical protein